MKAYYKGFLDWGENKKSTAIQNNSSVMAISHEHDPVEFTVYFFYNENLKKIIWNFIDNIWK